ncbi:MAG TPA: tetratricopeptide repeat protein [Xanthobacteraceae bacterium]|nr:tetratricopeptide repeat protein [Xanthobacteraceae bacterium]
MKKTSGLALAILLSAAALPAAAQTPDDCFQATLKTDDQAIIRVCTQALDRGGLDVRTRSITLSNRGLGYLRSKDFDKSIIDFSEALLIDPKNAFSFNFRGEAWREKGNFDRALADFEDALGVDPDFTAAFYNRGLTYERQGNPTGARAEYQKAIALKGDRAIDNWARDRARERLTALGDNPQQNQQQNTQPRNDDRGRDRDRNDRNDRTTQQNQQQQQQNNDPGRGNEGGFQRRR